MNESSSRSSVSKPLSTERSPQPPIRVPILVRSGLSRMQVAKIRDRVDATGKCCEGGSEGWTG